MDAAITSCGNQQMMFRGIQAINDLVQTKSIFKNMFIGSIQLIHHCSLNKLPSFPSMPLVTIGIYYYVDILLHEIWVLLHRLNIFQIIKMNT